MNTKWLEKDPKELLLTAFRLCVPVSTRCTLRTREYP